MSQRAPRLAVREALRTRVHRSAQVSTVARKRRNLILSAGHLVAGPVVVRKILLSRKHTSGLAIAPVQTTLFEPSPWIDIGFVNGAGMARTAWSRARRGGPPSAHSHSARGVAELSNAGAFGRSRFLRKLRFGDTQGRRRVRWGLVRETVQGSATLTKSEERSGGEPMAPQLLRTEHKRTLQLAKAPRNVQAREQGYRLHHGCIPDVQRPWEGTFVRELRCTLRIGALGSFADGCSIRCGENNTKL